MIHWFLGTIGFSYKDWVGSFYPVGTSQRGYLPYYTKVFNCVELDTTFHAIPSQSTIQSWVNSTPVDFRFCLKTPRLITHDLGLKGAQGPMIEFIDSLNPIKDKLGPILIQLPPKYTQDNYSLVDDFLASLPETHHFAIEFRHPSWYNAKTTQMLAQYQVGWATSDYPNLPRQIIPTSDFLYIRWIGMNGMYQHHAHEQVDKTSQLKWWLETIRPFFERVPEVYGFFNNDYAGFAAGTCKRFKLIAGLSDEEENLPYQGRLF